MDTNQPDLKGLPRFAFDQVYEVTGRSLLLFMLRPEAGAFAGGDADRSFDHVTDILKLVDEMPSTLR